MDTWGEHFRGTVTGSGRALSRTEPGAFEKHREGQSASVGGVGLRVTVKGSGVFSEGRGAIAEA